MTNYSFAKNIKLDTSAIDGIEGISQEQKIVLKSQLTAQFQAEQLQYNKEFERYKQDCRKRALDSAGLFLEREYAIWEKKKEGDRPTIESLADKYYNWLISIPQ